MDERATWFEQGFVKIRTSGDDGIVETLWAQRIGGRDDCFRLDNSPFFAYRMSADDVVEGSPISPGMYDFVRVVEHSGNRTVRLMFATDRVDSPLGVSVLDRLTQLGCTFENMNNALVSITVPASVSLDAVATYLTSTGLQWEYADPTYDDLFGPD
jgi:uncharacterized protein DUF4265